jgi:septum formation protein
VELVQPGPEKEAANDVEPKDYVCQEAKAKALGARVGGLSGILLSGDTVVTLEGRILGKPQNRNEAEAMLRGLMGRTHEVWTAIAMLRVEGGRILPDSLVFAGSCSRVYFGEIPPTSLSEYLAGEEWRDKAGAYGIQGWAGAFTELVEGSFDTVVGLPMGLFHQLWNELMESK